MIRSSACQPQADQFPALSGRHGDCRSYTTKRETILSGRNGGQFMGEPLPEEGEAACRCWPAPARGYHTSHRPLTMLV
jgi:hypothetical protein